VVLLSAAMAGVREGALEAAREKKRWVAPPGCPSSAVLSGTRSSPERAYVWSPKSTWAALLELPFSATAAAARAALMFPLYCASTSKRRVAGAGVLATNKGMGNPPYGVKS